MDAQKLCQLVSAQYFEQGAYELSNVRVSRASVQASLSSVEDAEDDEEIDDDEPIPVNLVSVQSVAYTKGADEEKVIVYVSKGAKKWLASLESEYEGTKIIYKSIGKVRSSPSPLMLRSGGSHFFERGSRIACGGSCGTADSSSGGTLGALVQDRSGKIFALSNNHVFANCNHSQLGSYISSPFPSDSFTGRRPPEPIGVFSKMIEFRSGALGMVQPMQVDAALAEVTNPDILSSWQGDESGFDTPDYVTPPFSGMRVKKIGRTTGLTTGVVEGLQYPPWPMQYKSKKFSAEVWFRDTWTVRTDDGSPFSAAGDSGSLVVTERGDAAVGLIFAAGVPGQYGIICDLTKVLQSLGNLTLVSNHGL